MSHKCLSCQISNCGAALQSGYHPRCSEKLFGTPGPPEIHFSTPDIVREARRMAGRISVSGVQPKLSVVYNRKKHLLTSIEKGGAYILKPQTEIFESLPENENLCMRIAYVYGIAIPPHGLIRLADDRLAYLVRRFDRLDDGSKLHQEDFQQLLQSNDKYEGSYEKIARFVKKHSATPAHDLVRLYKSALLFFVLGNGDAHLKNFSLIRSESGPCHLSPAYDIVSSRLVLPEEKEEMCLSIQGRRNRLSIKDFVKLSKHFGLRGEQANHALRRLTELKPVIESMIRKSFLNQRLKHGFLEIFRERMRRLQPRPAKNPKT
ncbi:MAG: hypothetical protein DRI57_02640 [Deltaproteobacteria bacterium]|nr:MAG: hypothetical protein DRI57_02640 [Deltaproteobacteria bacterium]